MNETLSKKGWRTIIILAIIFVLVLSVGAYIFYQSNQTKTSGEVMMVAKYYWPGTYWVEIAEAKGWFKEAGLNVKLIDTNKDYLGSLADVVSGKIDTANFSPFDLVEYNAKGADLVSIINSDFSNGTDGIVGKKEFKGLADLRGKRVAVPLGTYLDYILNPVLQQNGLDPNKDVVKINANPEEMADGFALGKYEAIVSWQPLLSLAATKGDGKIIFDTSQIKGLNSGNWVFKRSFINNRTADVQAFVKVWDKTTRFIKSNPQEAYSIIARNYKVSVEDVANLEKIDTISTREEALSDFSFGSGLDSLHGSITKINRYLLDQNIIRKEVSSLDIIDARFIRNLSK
jgi:NitT/TauT family transport system substrate-binding protein